MENNWNAGISLEHSLFKQQQFARNLTTYRPYPMPGRLVEIPYPLDRMGKPVKPHELTEYARNYSFDMPRCYHSHEAKLYILEESTARKKRVCLVCPLIDVESADVVLNKTYPECSFIVFLDDFLEGDSQADFCMYGKRIPSDEKTTIDAKIASEIKDFSKMFSHRSFNGMGSLPPRLRGREIPRHVTTEAAVVQPNTADMTASSARSATSATLGAAYTYPNTATGPGFTRGAFDDVGAARPLIALPIRDDPFCGTISWGETLTLMDPRPHDVPMDPPAISWSSQELYSVIDGESSESESE